MQWFVLDFDETLPLHEAYARIKKYELPILFVYETFSSVDYNRFRLVFLNDISVTDIRAAQIIQNTLMTIFPEADEQCRSVVQIYYGGKKLLKFDESIPTINIELLVRNMTFYLRDQYGDTNYKRKIVEVAKTNKIRLTDKKLLDISVVNDIMNLENESPDKFDRSDKNRQPHLL
jgi:hypothetical protein